MKKETPSPDTFDFEEYISGTSTFPEFTHTAYLDQASGMALVKAADRYEELASRAKEIQRRQRILNETVTRSLVDEDMDELTEELTGLEAQLAELETEIAELEEKVKQSGISLTFQVGTAEKLGSVVRAAEKEFVKKNGRGSNDDLDYITRKGKHILCAQLVAYCTQVTLPDGREIDPPDRYGFVHLIDRLIASESTRLMTALNEYLDSSVTWADRIDAGFPGGSADVARVPVGGAGSEDGESVDDTPSDAPDRGGI